MQINDLVLRIVVQDKCSRKDDFFARILPSADRRDSMCILVTGISVACYKERTKFLGNLSKSKVHAAVGFWVTISYPYFVRRGMRVCQWLRSWSNVTPKGLSRSVTRQPERLVCTAMAFPWWRASRMTTANAMNVTWPPPTSAPRVTFLYFHAPFIDVKRMACAMVCTPLIASIFLFHRHPSGT